MAGSTAKPASAPRTERRQLGLLRYLRESRAELKKVSWPTREQTTNLTIVVVIVCLVLAFALFGLDTLFTKIITALD